MGHGWPALGRQDAAARVHGRRWVAHAERASKGGVASLAGPLFSICPDGQFLPLVAAGGHTRCRAGGGFAMIHNNKLLRVMSIMS